jgi:GH18 family chitinase
MDLAGFWRENSKFQIPIEFLSDNGPYWIGYDDEESFTVKSKYINFKGLAGAMLWSVDTDDFRGTFSSKKFPLLHVIIFHVFSRIFRT